jgi:hypothetical protein
MNENLLAVLFLLVIFSPVIYQLIVVIREHKKERQVALKRFKKFLKYSLIVFVLTASVIGVLSHTNYLDYQSPMTYDEFDDITFENFRGIELFKKTFLGSKEFAYVVTTIDLSIDGNKVTVHSLFHPSRSFVYDQESNSEELLTHEKYHIKITELYARRARKQIAQLQSFSKETIESIVKLERQNEREFQKQYDYDTYHSYIYQQQKKYERTVDSLLSLLDDYKQPTITVYEKD